MKNSINVLIISIILGIVLIGSLLTFGKKTKDENLKLPITVEEYADFQCPACGQFYETVKEIREIEGVEYTFKHLPLTQIHQRAYSAAVASEAAREQNKFEEFHDKLFENQDNLEDEDFIKYAENLKLDIEKFKSDYESNQAVKDRVDANMRDAKEKGYNSTPTLIVNGERFTMVGKDSETIVNEIKALVEKAKENEINPIESPIPESEVTVTPESTPSSNEAEE
jgi:protein-disulfide isomerase